MISRIMRRLNVARQVTLGIAAIAAFAVPVAVGAIQQAPPDARPRFEVASIRPCEGTQGKMAADVSIFTAIQEQLGLRLERTTGPVPAVLVIDHVERPSPN